MSTTLDCLGWMQNQRDQSPCTTAQEVGQLCNAGYTVSLTNFQQGNYVPNATTVNDCTCSWSIYNLMSACSYCVGQRQYTSWNVWVTDCGSHASLTAYLPSGVTISQGIPYWAATNPSTWEDAVFNITQAADIAAEALPDVTGGPLPTITSTATASSASRVPVSAVVAGVIGILAIVVIGGLMILWTVRRQRRQGTHTTPMSVSLFDASQPVTAPVPSIRSATTVQPPQFGYAYAPPGSVSRLTSPGHSTTNLTSTSLFSPPVSPVYSMHGNSVAQPPLVDAADVISPFLATSSARRTNRSNPSLPTGKAAEASYERTSALPPLGRRARLNPPPYSASVTSPAAAVASGESSVPRVASTPTRKGKKRSEKYRVQGGNYGLGTFADVNKGEHDQFCPGYSANGEQSTTRRYGG